MKRFLSIVVSLTLMVSVAWGQKVSADETDPVRIMSAVQDRDEGDRSKSVMVMEVVDDKGRRRSRSITAWMKRFEEGRKQLMIFNAPRGCRGYGVAVHRLRRRRSGRRPVALPALAQEIDSDIKW